MKEKKDDPSGINPTQAPLVGSDEFLIAAEKGDIDVVMQYLRENKTNPNANKVINSDKLLWPRHLNVMQALLKEESFAVNLATTHGYTRLFLALHEMTYIEGDRPSDQAANRLAIVEAFLARSEIEVNSANGYDGKTPLMASVVTAKWDNTPGKEHYYAIVEALLARPGIEIDKADKNGDTALMEAARYNIVNIVQMLIEKGANPCLKNKEEKSAKDFTDNDEIQEILEKAELQSNSAATNTTTRQRMKEYYDRRYKGAEVYVIKNIQTVGLLSAHKSMAMGDTYFYHRKDYTLAVNQYVECVKIPFYIAQACIKVGRCLLHEADPAELANPDELSQFDLAAEYFREVLCLVPDFNEAQGKLVETPLCKFLDYTNALDGLYGCIKAGATIDEKDLVNTPFEDQPIKTINRERLQIALLQRLITLHPFPSVYEKELLSYTPQAPLVGSVLEQKEPTVYLNTSSFFSKTSQRDERVLQPSLFPNVCNRGTQEP
jgi:hypothetical protein